MENINRPKWCNWPDQENIRDLEDLYKVSNRCDAWKAFFNSSAVKKIKKAKGYILWFNKWEHFDKLICEIDLSEKKAQKLIKSLMLPGHEKPIIFKRQDIYDARGWVHLPLSCFVKIKGFNERSGKDHYQNKILEYNEMPIVQFGIKLPWSVSRKCFTLTHRLKYNERHAVMRFNHPDLDHRFEGKRWVAEAIFKPETTRKEMTEKLFTDVEDECAKYLVTITE